MNTAKYPKAKYLGNGKVYGNYVPAWNSTGFLPRLVWHTTETSSLPGYNNGAIAPHVTYDPKMRTFVQHAPFTGSVGALRDEVGGIRTNRDGAMQIELICYSAKSVADQSPNRLWVGNLSDDALQDLAEFAYWLFEEWAIPLALHPKTLLYTDGKAYGTKSLSRMSNSDWDYRTSSAGVWGWCGHRNVPENSHWDPGALNLTSILERAKKMAVTSPFTDVSPDDPAYDDIVYMFETGISKGYSGAKAGQYGPDDYVTRRQMASFLRRALTGGSTVQGKRLGLSDVEFVD